MIPNINPMITIPPSLKEMALRPYRSPNLKVPRQFLPYNPNPPQAPEAVDGYGTPEAPVGNDLPNNIAPTLRSLMYIGKGSTGWDKSDDGKFSSLTDKMERREISDKESSFKDPDFWGRGGEKIFSGRVGSVKLQDMLNHPELYKQYPDLNPTIEIDPRDKSERASYLDDKNTISMGLVGGMPDRDLLLHELQHAIQKREGFARGSNIGMERNIRIDNLKIKYESMLNQLKDKYGYQGLPFHKTPADTDKQKFMNKVYKAKERISNVENSGSFAVEKDRYNRSAGEVEARDTQTRSNMTMDERRSKSPLSSQRIKLRDMIVRKR